MNKILTLVFLINFSYYYSQIVTWGNSTINQRTEWYLPIPTSMDGNRTVVGWVKGKTNFSMNSDSINFGSLSGIGNRFVISNSTGKLINKNYYDVIDTNILATKYFSNIQYLKKTDTTNKWKSVNYTPNWNDITNKPTFFSGNYNDLINKPDLSIYYLNSNPSGYISSINSSMVVTALGYTPLNPNRTITINGVTYDLTTNRTWNVGDIFTTNIYNNPSWINTLNWNKITNTPTTVNGYGITDAVTNATLTTSLSTKENSISAGTTSQYWRGDKTWQTLNTVSVVESTNLYFTNARARNAISLTTSGSGAASYNSLTGDINIPTPISYSAGSGISLTSGVISNSSPDQIVTLNSGTGINITGVYPNFTVTNTSVPTSQNIYSVSRPINSTTYTISTTKNATVSYNIRISCNATIGSNSAGKVTLQYSTNGGSSWIDAAEVENTNTVTLAIALNSTTVQTTTMTAFIPANALVRMVQSSSGTTVITYVRGQEIY